MAQPKVRQGPETAQGRVPDCKATGRGEQKNSPTAASSSSGFGCCGASTHYLLLPKLNHSRFGCPRGTAGTNLPHCYASQNLHLNNAEVNWGVQQRCSQWYRVTSGKPRTAASCLGSGMQARPKASLSLEMLLTSWSSHRHGTLSAELPPGGQWTFTLARGNQQTQTSCPSPMQTHLQPCPRSSNVLDTALQDTRFLCW